jgi:Arc/MetJ-type ribon-helix-helix transcriptional regulator
MKTYTITLPDQIAEMVDWMLAAKKFDDLDHLMMYAVSIVEGEVRQDDEMTDEERDWLRKEIQKGLDSSARGEVGPMDFDEIDRKVEALLAAEEAARATSHANGAGEAGHRGDRTVPLTTQSPANSRGA